MKRSATAFVLLLGAGFLGAAGCGGGAGNTFEHFANVTPFPRGTSQDAVRAAWGEPDQIVPNGADELGEAKTIWVYTGRLPGVPLNYNYVSQTKKLYFDGDSLTRWESSRPESEFPDQPPAS